jgi:putative spermidine/putrescine transport system ATP-binding protein
LSRCVCIHRPEECSTEWQCLPIVCANSPPVLSARVLRLGLTGEGTTRPILGPQGDVFVTGDGQAQSLRVNRVSHRFGAVKALDDVSLDIAGGELVALLGPSGCGKTTLLRAIGGFITQSEGRIAIGGSDVDHLPPNKRAVGIVFQNYALFPHMTAAQNVAYGLEARGTPKIETSARVDEMLALVKLQNVAGRYPKELSGGQQQRIALARALAVRPAVLLLDEPFAALDKNLRLDMQIEIKRIQRLARTTTLIVTHDQEEALSMADRVAVFNQGRLEQFAPPSVVFDTPASLFVNTFVGAANVLQGTVKSVANGIVSVALSGGGEIAGRQMVQVQPGDRVTVCIRPEQLRRASSGLAATIEVGLPLGATIVHEARLANTATIKISEAREAGAEPLQPGTELFLAPASPTAATVFPAS